MTEKFRLNRFRDTEETVSAWTFTAPKKELAAEPEPAKSSVRESIDPPRPKTVRKETEIVRDEHGRPTKLIQTETQE